MALPYISYDLFPKIIKYVRHSNLRTALAFCLTHKNICEKSKQKIFHLCQRRIKFMPTLSLLLETTIFMSKHFETNATIDFKDRNAPDWDNNRNSFTIIKSTHNKIWYVVPRSHELFDEFSSPLEMANYKWEQKRWN